MVHNIILLRHSKKDIRNKMLLKILECKICGCIKKIWECRKKLYIFKLCGSCGPVPPAPHLIRVGCGLCGTSLRKSTSWKRQSIPHFSEQAAGQPIRPASLFATLVSLDIINVKF